MLRDGPGLAGPDKKYLHVRLVRDHLHMYNILNRALALKAIV